ncbi:MAG: UrcA family protein [Hyphomonadaceae bacterium]|nr:UrcA family protein [Hyphomonadaceae bacterium]
MTLRIALAAALIGLSFVAPAQARDYRLSLHRYELESAAGRSVVLDRIDRTVSRFCRQRGHTLADQIESQRCARETVDEILARIGDDDLLAQAEGRAEPPRLLAAR